jgi:tetratricopeptide (TPR) repeat protein
MSRGTRARLSFVALALAIGASAQAAGGVHPTVLEGYAVLVLVSGLSAIPWSAGGKAGGGGSARGETDAQGGGGAFGSIPLGARVAVVVCVWLSLAFYCLLQALPLPMGMLQVVAPDNADVWARALKPFGLDAPAYASISLAPYRSLLEALQFASYAVIFAVSALLGRRYGVRAIARTVYVSALAVAVVTALHQLLHAERLFGVYRPLDAIDIAPLLNPNNRAGYLNLGFFCGLGLLFLAGGRPRAVLIGLSLVFLAAAILSCQSRAGTACAVLGLVVLLLVSRQRGRGERRFELGRGWQAAIAVGIAAGGTLMVLSTRPSGALGFQDRSLEKLDLLRKSIQLALDHAGVGVGRGAFGSVFSAYQAPGWPRVYEHAENFPIQWAAEWGIVVAVTALGALGWSLWPALRGPALNNPVRRGAIVGCLMLLLQNLVDLGLEIPAVAAACVALLGALLGGAPDVSGPGRARGGLLAVGAGFTAVCLVLALIFGVESPGRVRDRLRSELASHPEGSTAFWSALERSIRAYPADPYFPLLGSAAALGAGQNALPWVARALERGPTNGTAHIYLARALQAQGATRQAFDALHRAALLDPSQIDQAVRLAFAWNPSDVASVVPDGAAGAPVLRALADKARDLPQRVRWLEAALERDPGDADGHYRLASLLFQDLVNEQQGVVCPERSDWCASAVVEHARRAESAGSSSAAILGARVLEWQSGAREAEAALAAVCSRLPADLECASELVSLAIRNESPRLPEAVNALVALGCGTPASCGQTHMTLGDRFARAGQWPSAASHYRWATRETPSPATWRALARASRELGQSVRADDALRRAELLDVTKSSPQ